MPTRRDQIVDEMTSRDSIAEKVRQLVAEYSSVDVGKVQETTVPHNDLGWDSLDDVEMAMELEEEFNIDIPDDFGQELTTVGHIIDNLAALVARKRAE